MATTPHTAPELNLDSSTWEGWFNSLIVWTAQNPMDFLYYVLLGLSPFVVLSLLLSWKLAKMLEKEKKKKARRESSAMKATNAMKAALHPTGSGSSKVKKKTDKKD